MGAADVGHGEPDLVVVGAGPAGLALATAVAKTGARVIVLDRGHAPGGMPQHCHHTGFGLFDRRRMLSGPRYARAWAEDARRAGVDTRVETTVLAIDPTERAVQTTSPQGLEILRPRAIALATGCRERPRAARLIAGSRPAGVFTTGSLQQVVHEQGARPGTRAVVVGAEHVSYSAILTLRNAGIAVAAVVTEHATHQTLPIAALGFHTILGVPLRTSCVVEEIVGRGRVSAVVVRNLESGSKDSLPCDIVVFTADWIPDNELARSAGLDIDPGTKGPRIDLQHRTSAHGVFAVGNAVHGAEMADLTALEGSAAAPAVRAFLDGAPWPSGHVPLEVSAPLQFIAPNALAMAPQETQQHASPRDLIVWTKAIVSDATLRFTQGSATLAEVPVGRLVPGRAARVPHALLARVRADGGPIRVGVP